jgi:hypothetical protein
MERCLMGKAKRRKALGFGSAQNPEWRYEERCAKSGFKSMLTCEDRSQRLMTVDVENFRRGEKPLGFPLAFVGELLRRAKSSPEWEARRDHIARLLGAAQNVLIYGTDASEEEARFLKESAGDSVVFFPLNPLGVES